ncbi:MAG: hypothetical protein O7G30_05890 [Proteobacteria bacterium]|nr:hypothetical protein [Pseudomonadota bacterium]
MEFPEDIRLRFVLGAVVVLAILAVRLPSLRRFEPWAFGLAAAVGLAAFFNFGSLRHHFDEGFVNRWELFHYQLGSKYFPELGFDGIYAASYAAQLREYPDTPIAPAIRDLRTNELTVASEHMAHMTDVMRRFTPERWQLFESDHRVYTANTTSAFWQYIRSDHGFNPSPAWTFVARVFSGPLPPGYASWILLAGLDLVLLLGMFVVVFRTYGYRIGCLALAICGLRYGWPYVFLGAFLRLDWLVSVVVGICMLKRERFASAGACFAYATLVRVFPVLFLTGPLLLAGRSVMRGQLPRWALRLAAGFGAVLVLGLVVGALAGRGPQAWIEFAERMQLYVGLTGGNLVGSDTLVITGPGFLLASLEWPQYTVLDPSRVLDERWIARCTLRVGLLALAAVAMWRSRLDRAGVLGVIPIFALTTPVAYYWIMLAVLPLFGGAIVPVAVLALAAALHGIHLFYLGPDYTQFLCALLAMGLLGICIGWALWVVVHRNRDAQAPAQTQA